MWTKYRAQVHPERVTRIAVRYINRIEITEREFELSGYLTAYPELPDSLPFLSRFRLQLESPQRDIENGHLVMSQGIIESNDPGVTPVLLDLDLYRTVDLPVDDGLWQHIGELHVAENRIFESCITDRTRELFNAPRR
jgi:uncharacterized protein (TIGR04255 family)